MKMLNTPTLQQAVYIVQSPLLNGLAHPGKGVSRPVLQPQKHEVGQEGDDDAGIGSRFSLQAVASPTEQRFEAFEHFLDPVVACLHASTWWAFQIRRISQAR